MSTVTRIVHISHVNVDFLLDALDIILDSNPPSDVEKEINALADAINDLSLDSVLIKFGKPD